MAALDGVSDFDSYLPRERLLICDPVIIQPMDFTCVETQIGNGDPLDCEVLEIGELEEKYEVTVPL